ncbi:MAG: hypothetical protein QHD01_02790 [Bradyrhizobium sp.]|uniref:hypothetical protein n=1 Tax=Bradyrhizobium sp. TaxID=376 RepID=UPI0029B8B347|nr:hypothetical protein [Bradyrhizobium sp.]MDX3965511.1 hypothetical protein [Bradyrhizobium sp.]
MNTQSIKLGITGTKRLLMHSGRLADPLDPISRDLARLTAKRPKTEADHLMIAKTEWYGSLWLSGGVPCIPAEALMAVFRRAAKTVRRGQLAAAGLVVQEDALLIYDGPRDVDELWESGRYSFRAAVRVGSSKTMRTRPRFENWRTEFTAHFLPTVLDLDQVLEVFSIAGVLRGLGDWVPENGTFSVERLE